MLSAALSPDEYWFDSGGELLYIMRPVPVRDTKNCICIEPSFTKSVKGNLQTCMYMMILEVT